MARFAKIARFGTSEQRDAATSALDDLKRKLYAILADVPADPGPSDPGPDGLRPGLHC